VTGITPQTWHHGLVAEWWAEFNVDGPEIHYFGRFVAEGQPALDAGCGAGRLLLPWLRAGHDVDGADVSADMVERARASARSEGFVPTLLVQPLHELDPPRRYRTIVACGVFGIGSTRAQDEEALRRFHANLEPGGMLLLDKEVPYADSRRWPYWATAGRKALPEPWPEQGRPRTTSDGSQLDLRVRALAVDPLDQTITLELRAQRLRDGEVVAEETYALTERMYFRDELVTMLEQAGFAAVEIRGGYEDEQPTAEHDFLVYAARKG
jgi:cyclopropane fatty-acyl-phospholipid synthase-like methyltransferase